MSQASKLNLTSQIVIMNKLRAVFFFVPFLLFTIACNQEEDVPTFQNVTSVEGYRPIYIPAEEAKEVVALPPKPLEQPGKIMVYQHYLFINELRRGVHVFDNEDPKNPEPLSFLKIPGNIDIAIKGDILYADNVADLVALDISNVRDIKIKKRIAGVFGAQVAIPSETGIYFECPDPSKGVVVGWEPAILKNPKCYR